MIKLVLIFLYFQLCFLLQELEEEEAADFGQLPRQVWNQRGKKCQVPIHFLMVSFVYNHGFHYHILSI